MSCTYMVYKENDVVFPRLYCSLDDTYCLYAKRCSKQQKFIANGDLYKECKKRPKTEMPKGAYKIELTRKCKNGGLWVYVEIKENEVKKFRIDEETIDQDYIYIKRDKVSLTPFDKKGKINEN